MNIRIVMDPGIKDLVVEDPIDFGKIEQAIENQRTWIFVNSLDMYINLNKVVAVVAEETEE